MLGKASYFHRNIPSKKRLDLLKNYYLLVIIGSFSPLEWVTSSIHMCISFNPYCMIQQHCVSTCEKENTKIEQT